MACQLLPIEFSLAQSLHFCTMLALPLPPFSGTLSCGIIADEHGGYGVFDNVQIKVAKLYQQRLFLSLPLGLYTAIYLGSLHSFRTSAILRGKDTKGHGLSESQCQSISLQNKQHISYSSQHVPALPHLASCQQGVT